MTTFKGTVKAQSSGRDAPDGSIGTEFLSDQPMRDCLDDDMFSVNRSIKEEIVEKSSCNQPTSHEKSLISFIELN
jgi:hypothetical protein